MNPFHVAYVAYGQEMSGAEVSLLDLLRWLPRERVQPTLVCPEGHPLIPEMAALEVEVLTVPAVKLGFPRRWLEGVGYGRLLFSAAAQLRRALAGRALDLVHTNCIRSGLIASVANTPHRFQHVAHVRDCLPPGWPSSLIAGWVVWRAQAIVANSQHTLRRFCPALWRNGKGHVVYNGVDLSRFDPERVDARALREEWTEGEEGPLIGFVGQITPWKGIRTLLEAFPSVASAWPSARLVLVGGVKFTDSSARYDNCAYAAELHAVAEQLGLRDKVVWAGERADIPQVMSALDVLVLPSWEEPFGRVLIEAMAMERPVVATNVGGPRES